jgi:hypothetical protein
MWIKHTKSLPFIFLEEEACIKRLLNNKLNLFIRFSLSTFNAKEI